MEEYVCPKCGRTSYTSGSLHYHSCPYCSVRQVIVARDFAPARDKIAEAFTHWPDAVVMLDRRFEDRRSVRAPVDSDRRDSDRRSQENFICAVRVSSVPPA